MDYAEDDPKSPFLRTFRILARTRFSRIVWVMPTAVHRHVSVTPPLSKSPWIYVTQTHPSLLVTRPEADERVVDHAV